MQPAYGHLQYSRLSGWIACRNHAGNSAYYASDAWVQLIPDCGLSAGDCRRGLVLKSCRQIKVISGIRGFTPSGWPKLLGVVNELVRSSSSPVVRKTPFSSAGDFVTSRTSTLCSHVQPGLHGRKPPVSSFKSGPCVNGSKEPTQGLYVRTGCFQQPGHRLPMVGGICQNSPKVNGSFHSDFGNSMVTAADPVASRICATWENSSNLSRRRICTLLIVKECARAYEALECRKRPKRWGCDYLPWLAFWMLILAKFLMHRSCAPFGAQFPQAIRRLTSCSCACDF